MIVEWFIGLWEGFISWVLGMFAGMEVPAWFEAGPETIISILNNGAGLGAWVPWALVIAAVGATFGIWIIGFVVKFARWLVGWIPTMGGS